MTWKFNNREREEPESFYENSLMNQERKPKIEIDFIMFIIFISTIAFLVFILVFDTYTADTKYVQLACVDERHNKILSETMCEKKIMCNSLLGLVNNQECYRSYYESKVVGG